MTSPSVGYFLSAQDSQSRTEATQNFINAISESSGSYVEVTDLTESTLQQLDILWYERPYWKYSDSRLQEYERSFVDGDIANFVNSGGTLIYNDWTLGSRAYSGNHVAPSDLTSNLPGYSELGGTNIIPWSYGRNNDINNDEIENSSDPNRSLDNSSLDGGWYTRIGAVNSSDLSDEFDLLLTNDSSFRSTQLNSNPLSDPDQASSFAYEYGQGDVILTTVPVAGYFDLDSSFRSNYSHYQSDYVGYNNRYGGSNSYDDLQDSVHDYVANLVDYTASGSATKDLVFSHKLFHEDSVTLADSFVAAPFGTTTDKSKKYVLEINVQNKAGDSLDLNGVDLTLGFDQSFFNDISLSDVSIDQNFKFFNSALIDNQGGSIRIAAGSSDHLGGGTGVLDDSTGSIFRVVLDLDDDAFVAYNDLPDINFSISANLDETVFLSTASADPTEYLIQSLRDIGGDAVVGLADDEYDMDWQDSIGTSNVDIKRQTDSEVFFGTQRHIGSSSFTNLVRKGDSLYSSSSVLFENEGSSGATSARLKSFNTQSDPSSSLQFLLQYQSDQHSGGPLNSSSSYSSVHNLSEIYAGSFNSNGIQNTHDRDRLTVDYKLDVDGNAGEIIDTSKLGIQFSAAGGYRSNQALGNTKNLITYQADVDYDGRVSMSDLAHVNAGAEAINQGSSSSVSDVDVDFDGSITISDLAIMDDDWGKSLHDPNVSNSFTGSNLISLSDISSQSTDLGDVSWSDTSFFDQNQIEDSSLGFIGSLDSPSSPGVVKGLSEINEDDMSADSYVDFQANNT